MSESQSPRYLVDTALRRASITITGKTTDLTVVLKTLTDAINKEDKPRKVHAEGVGYSLSVIFTGVWLEGKSVA